MSSIPIVDRIGPRKFIAGFATSLLLLAAACSQSQDETQKTAGAAPSVAVTVTPTGEGEVTIKDDQGQPISTKGATGRIELADGETIPLAPDIDGRTLRAPLGGRLEAKGESCAAKLRVLVPGRMESSTSVDLCREHRNARGERDSRHGPGRGEQRGHGPR